MKLAILSLAVAAVAAVTAPTFAATSLIYADSDTRTNSSSAPAAFSNTAAGDTDGSLKYSTGNAGGGNKVAVTFYQPGAAALGTIGDLSALSFDYYQDSASTGTGGSLAPAVRLKLSPLGTSSATYIDLVYEPVYQPGFSGTSPKDAWQNNVDVKSGKLWQRSNGVNHDGNDGLGNANSDGFQFLPAWIGGFNPGFNGPGVALNANTPIYGIEISLGSGLPNNFTAYIDDVNVVFGNGNSFAANIAVPEPTTLAALAGASVLGLRRRRA